MRNTTLHPAHRSPSKVFTALCVAAAVAVSVLILTAGPDRSDACRKHYVRHDPRPSFAKIGNRWEIRVSTYSRSFSFRGSNLRLKDVYVYTKDKRFAEFIKQRATRAQLFQVIKTASQKHHCSDMLQGSRMVSVEKNVARALAAYYQKETRRRVRVPDVMLGLHTPYRIYCNPPK